MAGDEDGGLLGALEFAGVELGEGDLDVVRLLDPSRPPRPAEDEA